MPNVFPFKIDAVLEILDVKETYIYIYICSYLLIMFKKNVEM